MEGQKRKTFSRFHFYLIDLLRENKKFKGERRKKKRGRRRRRRKREEDKNESWCEGERGKEGTVEERRKWTEMQRMES